MVKSKTQKLYASLIQQAHEYAHFLIESTSFHVTL